MPSDPTKARQDGAAKPARQAPEADLPQAPPGAPEGHDARAGAVPPPGTVPPVGGGWSTETKKLPSAVNRLA